LLTLGAGFLLPKDSTGLFTNRVELTLGENSPQRVAYLAKFDPDKNTIRSQWVDERLAKRPVQPLLQMKISRQGIPFRT
jgi:hypothetical protein